MRDEARLAASAGRRPDTGIVVILLAGDPQHEREVQITLSVQK
jgi:hypothetical protein